MSDNLHDDLARAQLALARKQERWETRKAIAMIALAAAAIAAAGGLAARIFPTAPQTITVHLDGPLTIAPSRP